jgi:hypothetical protein
MRTQPRSDSTASARSLRERHRQALCCDSAIAHPLPDKTAFLFDLRRAEALKVIGAGGGESVELPSDLREAIAAEPGGRVVLVIGAGTSVEAPMGLPMARECSERAHRKLIHDGVLQEGDCSDPSDLSYLADLVYKKTGGKQRELVKRLPIDDFRTVTPNRGCLLAAALLREGALKGVLTLNFDLGMVTALAQIGSNNDVSVLTGPADHERMGATNLVYLHRSVNADYEEWVLRTDVIAEGWQEGWEEVVGGLLIGGPFTVFAGLGSPAGVLIATAKKIKDTLPDEAKLLQVDPADPADSPMRTQIGIEEENYVQLGWGDFMGRLAARLLARHRDELYDACQAIITREGLDDGDPGNVCDRLSELDLIGVGEVRARWLLERRQRYLPQGALDVELVASLLLAIALIERRTETIANFHPDGIVEFVKEGHVQASLLFASGRGTRGWSAVEADLSQPAFDRSRRLMAPRYAVIGGVGARETVAPPLRLIGEDEGTEENIIGDDETLILRSVDELCTHPELVEEMIA